MDLKSHIRVLLARLSLSNAILPAATAPEILEYPTESAQTRSDRPPPHRIHSVSAARLLSPGRRRVCSTPEPDRRSSGHNIRSYSLHLRPQVF